MEKKKITFAHRAGRGLGKYWPITVSTLRFTVGRHTVKKKCEYNSWGNHIECKNAVHMQKLLAA